MFIENIKRELIDLFENPEFEFIGCTVDELDKLKENQQVSFIPDLYRQLMLTMGHKGIDDLFLYLRCTYRDAETLKNAALPPESFAFMEDAGVCLYYFRTDDKQDDTAVYVTGDDQPVAAHFSEFVEHFIDIHWQSIEDDQEGKDAYYYDAATGEFSVIPPRRRPKR